jgi:predicted MPP superfamily phosphohydrolase
MRVTQGSSAFGTVARAIGIASLGALLWGTLIERQLFTVRRHSLPVLSPGSAPIRVLHISDLHLAPWQNRKMQWVRSLAQLAPDLIVSTGDSMGHLEALPMLRHTLEPFAGIPGAFVYGSNDYYGPKLKNPLKYLQEPSRLSTREKDIDNAALTALLTDELGWVDLNNSAARVTARGSQVELFGMNDPHIHYDDESAMDAALTALRKTQVSAKQTPVTRLGAVHAPYRSALDALLDEGAEVIFAGHTHGGQVCIPGVGALTTNCDLPRQQAKGLSVWFSQKRAAFLNVSAGLGHSIYSPVRFACRPEVSLITLTAPR